MRTVLLVPLDGLALEQPFDDLHVLLEPCERDRTEPQGPTGGEAGRRTKDDPARRQGVQRSETARGNRSDSIRWDQDAGAKLDPGGLHGRRAHGHEHLCIQQLRVVEPRVSVSELFRTLHHLPGTRLGRQAECKVHGRFPSCPCIGRCRRSRARCPGEMRSRVLHVASFFFTPRPLSSGGHLWAEDAPSTSRCPDSEVRIILRHPRVRTSESKDTSKLLI